MSPLQYRYFPKVFFFFFFFNFEHFIDLDIYFRCQLYKRIGTHTASCTMGIRGPFPGGKARPERDADHSPPSSAEVKNE
jgi:hypothetical protein